MDREQAEKLINGRVPELDWLKGDDNLPGRTRCRLFANRPADTGTNEGMRDGSQSGRMDAVRFLIF